MSKARVQPNVDEIMKLHRLSMRMICNNADLTEDDLAQANELEQKSQGFDELEIVHSAYQSAVDMINLLEKALDKLHDDYEYKNMALAELAAWKREMGNDILQSRIK